uniref:Uncharacterized protein n=1 Tax=Rhizophora mucronata TaxID=61149 RepID=A0A2P2QR41_RHIMU
MSLAWNHAIFQLPQCISESIIQNANKTTDCPVAKTSSSSTNKLHAS